MRCRNLPLSLLLTTWALAFPVGSTEAEDGTSETLPEVTMVEETWELRVGEPNLERNAPQVTMIMSPYNNVEANHFVLTLNHRNFNDYSAGGIQLQDWYGEQAVTYRNGPQGSELHHTDETITWVQRMDVNGGTVTFEVVAGSSESWGAFGGQGYLRSSITTGQANLNSYTPGVSLTESGIGFAGNRVDSLTLQRVRWFLADGTIYEMTAPFDIDADLDPWDD